MREEIDDYSLVDINVRYFLRRKTELAFLIHNALDEDVFEPTLDSIFLQDDLPLLGRRILIEVRHIF